MLTHGTKNEMIARHSYFINLYNANVDATNPKSKGDLLREVKKWEKAQQSNEAKNANLIKKSLTNPEEINFYDILFICFICIFGFLGFYYALIKICFYLINIENIMQN